MPQLSNGKGRALTFYILSLMSLPTPLRCPAHSSEPFAVALSRCVRRGALAAPVLLCRRCTSISPPGAVNINLIVRNFDDDWFVPLMEPPEHPTTTTTPTPHHTRPPPSSAAFLFSQGLKRKRSLKLMDEHLRHKNKQTKEQTQTFKPTYSH